MKTSDEEKSAGWLRELAGPSSRIELNEKKLSLVQNHVPLLDRRSRWRPGTGRRAPARVDCTVFFIINCFLFENAANHTGREAVRGHNWRPFGANQLRPKAMYSASAHKRLFKFTLIYYFNGSAQMIIARQPAIRPTLSTRWWRLCSMLLQPAK